MKTKRKTINNFQILCLYKFNIFWILLSNFFYRGLQAIKKLEVEEESIDKKY